MQSIRIAAVSMNSELGKQQQTMDRIADFCEQAAAEKAELVLFPELVVHGHCNPDTWKVAEPVPDGPSTQKLVELAMHFGFVLSAGLCEKENDIVYNTQIVAGPDGYVGKQRKIHMSRDESFFYKGGREINVFDIGKCKIGIVICYDNQFPEVGRIVALKGADIILMPHAARQGKWDSPEAETAARKHVFDHFTSAYRMRARENACFVILADQAGKAGTVDSLPPEHMNQPHHPGAALVIDPHGTVTKHAQTEKIQDEMIVCDLDADVLAEARSHPNYTIRTRRPEVFEELVREQVSS